MVKRLGKVVVVAEGDANEGVTGTVVGTAVRTGVGTTGARNIRGRDRSRTVVARWNWCNSGN